MRAIILASVLITVVLPDAYGQTKDSAIDLADVTDKPTLISRPDLGYKDCYKEAGLTGTDVVKFVIDTSGRVDSLSVGLTEVTDPILDSLAVRLVRGMVFRPGSKAGAKVPVSVGLPVHFGGGAAPATPDARVFDEKCVDKKPVMKTRVTGYSLAASTSAQGQHVTLRVEAVIDTAGVARVIDVAGATGINPDIVQHARDGVASATFEPGQVMGNRVTVRMIVPMQTIIVVQTVPN